jgi:hypothetical protein
MHPVAGVQHRQTGRACEQVRSAAGVVAQDDCLGPERSQREAGVLERFALFDRGGLVADQRGRRAKALCGEFKGCPGAGAGLIEEQRDAPAGEQLRPLGIGQSLDAGGRGEDR